jgi:hypothetical protein
VIEKVMVSPWTATSLVIAGSGSVSTVAKTDIVAVPPVSTVDGALMVSLSASPALSGGTKVVLPLHEMSIAVEARKRRAKTQ